MYKLGGSGKCTKFCDVLLSVMFICIPVGFTINHTEHIRFPNQMPDIVMYYQLNTLTKSMVRSQSITQIA